MQGNIVYISPLQADSMLNQANLFKRLLEECGYEAIFKSTISVEDLNSDDVAGAIWFQLATINFIGDAVVPYILGKKPKVLYVTIEGVPTRGNIAHSNIKRCEFVAVSKFVKECLQSVGLKVRKVVHHAIDWKLCGEIHKRNLLQKRQTEQLAKDRVKFIVVARDDPRKNLKGLADAMRILNQKGYEKDYVVFLITNDSAKEKFQGINNAVFLKGFGGSPHETILGYMACCDYLIHPAFSGGFELPILEANAVGIPALHTDAPPMNEFSSPDFNFVFNYVDKQPVKANQYQYWIFHVFTPDMLAEVIDYAIDIFKNHRAEYEEYCTKAREWTRKWDYHVKYVELMKELKLPLPPWLAEMSKIEDYEIVELSDKRS